MTRTLPTKINEIISVDFFGPLPLGRGGVDMILVIQDQFSKFVKLYPMKNTTSTNTVNNIEKYIAQYGKPSTILSDNGPQFKSNFWREYWKRLEIEFRFTSTYTPSSNPVERQMSVIQALIRLYCSDKHSRWPLVLQDVENRINFVENGSTKAIPYEVMMKKPVDDPLLDLLQIDRKVDENLDTYVRNNLIDSFKKRKNVNFDTVKLSPNVIVYVKTNILSSKAKGIAKKLSDVYTGPYRVILEKYPNVYELVLLSNPKIRKRVNIRNLKVVSENQHRSDLE